MRAFGKLILAVAIALLLGLAFAGSAHEAWVAWRAGEISARRDATTEERGWLDRELRERSILKEFPSTAPATAPADDPDT